MSNAYCAIKVESFVCSQAFVPVGSSKVAKVGIIFLERDFVGKGKEKPVHALSIKKSIASLHILLLTQTHKNGVLLGKLSHATYKR